MLGNKFHQENYLLLQNMDQKLDLEACLRLLGILWHVSTNSISFYIKSVTPWSLFNILFYQMSCSEFFPNVVIKQLGLSQVLKVSAHENQGNIGGLY